MSEYRVVFKLANGQRKYATHQGKVLLWDEEDIKAIKINFIKFEQFAFTEDLEHFAFSTDELVQKFPRSKIIRVKGVRAIPADEPLDQNVLL